jgi:FKBP-type peptidyl-prolyl cis-trans isomerase FkpA
MQRLSKIVTAFLLVTCASAQAVTPSNIETLPSGVRVEHVVVGTGAIPGPTSMVTVHYRGTLLNGTEFDSSFKRNQPATFGLHQVIPCWTQGVQKMKVGGTAKLNCPAETAYGSRNLPGIPAGSVLNFEVQLLDSK